MAGLLVGVERRCDPATGKVLGGFTLPRLGLAADGLEARRGVLLEQAAKGIAGANRLELVGRGSEAAGALLGGGGAAVGDGRPGASCRRGGRRVRAGPGGADHA